ncbi:alpha/beta fold hydrolase [Streptomyces sp. NPDC048845]|uniref:esterase/lipase family protein n=1 Tax=Streptomyces sp. NPDC048845 TaxID=3155390 RepID=UPI003439754F
MRILPSPSSLPSWLPRPPKPSLPALPPLPSGTVLRATALELLILAGHTLLYPTGVLPERRGTSGSADGSAPEHSPERSPAHPTRPPPESPGPPRLPVPDPAAAPDRPPVLMVHGFADNRSVFVLLRRSLRRHGWQRLETLNHSPLTRDIRTAAATLGRRVEDICERTGRDRVDVVGHSLGGLIARYYVQRLGGDARVRTLVTLGTPHSGTRAVPPMTAHPVVRQMRPGSDVIEELTRPAPHCRTRFISFWSDLDHVMVPVETARIDHPDLVAHNVRVSGIGHLALPVHSAVAARIRHALDTPAAPGDAAGAASVA